MKDLKEAFSNRKSWHNNRASTVFPCFSSEKTIHYLVFQDYWSWKSNIKSEQIICIVRSFNSSEDYPLTTLEFTIESHNCINLNKEFELSNKKEDNSILPTSFEIEIISTKNLGFPFPGVMLFCVDEKSSEVTCVHSGGRRLNCNEKKVVSYFTESNWLAIENETFTPFFHIFNDSQEYPPNSHSTIEVAIHISGKQEDTFTSSITHNTTPFDSKIYYVSDIFSNQILEKIKNQEIWIEVSLTSSTFQRMIVGNYDKELDFHYITHSFGKVNSKDYIEPNHLGETTSFLPLINALPLNLKARSYPTNAKGSLEAQVSEYLPAIEGEKSIDSIVFETRGHSVNCFKNNSTSLKLYEIKSKCPARINVSYNYELKNSRHPTDIATGFKSRDYPQKISHWGHGVCSKEFKTLIFIRNISHTTSNVKEKFSLPIKISIFNENYSFTKTINLPSSGWNYIEITPQDFSESTKNFFSWRFKDFESKEMETFWVSYNINSGAICGEHGF